MKLIYAHNICSDDNNESISTLSLRECILIKGHFIIKTKIVSILSSFS